MQFDAVIFDLDGTLADTLDDIAASMNAALLQLGQPTHSRELYARVVGAGITNLARDVLPKDRQELVPDAIAAFRAHYSAHIVDRTQPFPGIPAMLDALVERGIKRAILSNKIDAMTRHIGELCFSKWSFDVVFGEREGVPRKPDPAAALEIAGLLGSAPERTLFVGDTAIDMKTAANAGMYGVGVLWGFRGREELESAGARELISDPAELVRFFDRA